MTDLASFLHELIVDPPDGWVNSPLGKLLQDRYVLPKALHVAFNVQAPLPPRDEGGGGGEAAETAEPEWIPYDSSAKRAANQKSIGRSLREMGAVESEKAWRHGGKLGRWFDLAPITERYRRMMTPEEVKAEEAVNDVFPDEGRSEPGERCPHETVRFDAEGDCPRCSDCGEKVHP